MDVELRAFGIGQTVVFCHERVGLLCDLVGNAHLVFIHKICVVEQEAVEPIQGRLVKAEVFEPELGALVHFDGACRVGVDDGPGDMAVGLLAHLERAFALIADGHLAIARPWVDGLYVGICPHGVVGLPLLNLVDVHVEVKGHVVDVVVSAAIG